ncbi:hypothetical protein MPTP_0201 [Melissococcus plutonius ATCC 35311]|uniref:Uncharacterized protein n=1 Tax=Melissococcus plutonius (strain ATCC 35311 / DSM 29964 / CIP 104052 / LMG 20360 / NCIMB 702443) TaxID=940190 RepID=F3Y872_MELPT|nr:hypothetical protein MPTP_0201 [Melissococcus plutonius ATCC 35311]
MINIYATIFSKETKIISNERKGIDMKMKQTTIQTLFLVN